MSVHYKQDLSCKVTGLVIYIAPLTICNSSSYLFQKLFTRFIFYNRYNWFLLCLQAKLTHWNFLL